MTHATAEDTTPRRPSAPGWLRRNRASIVTALAIGAVLAMALYARLFAPVRVRAWRVERGPISALVFGRGFVESEREAQLGFDLVGRLSDVLVDEGARVALGQPLARLHPEQVSADLHAATSGVAAARSSLQRLAAEEQRARTSLEAAEREERRMAQLAASGSVSTREMDVVQDALRMARAEVDRVLGQRSEATRSIDVAEGGASQRRVTMLRATLLAPFEGLVTQRLREPGDTVSVGSTVLRLVDTEHVYVRAWVDETSLGALREGMAVQISRPGDAQRTPGVVRRIGWESDRQTHELLVDVTPSAPLGRVSIGQRADVWITTDTRPDVVRVPTGFVLRDDAGAFCNVDRGGRVAVVRVRLGLLGRDEVEVAAGLRDGDTVLAPLKPGGTLRVGTRWSRP